MRCAVTFAFVLFATAPLPAVDTQSTESNGLESLGRELLDDLTPDVQRIPAKSPERSEPRAPHFNDLGEDIGQPSGPLSLVRVREAMAQAESLLSQQQTAASAVVSIQQATTAQQQVVDTLDKLIAELSKQCQGGQCQPSDQPPKPSQRLQSKPGKPSAAGGRGQTAARDSTNRLGQAAAKPPESGDLDAVVKDLWGHLPARSREQMLQSFSDEFLPQYESEIEQYYRRLSEEQQSRPSP